MILDLIVDTERGDQIFEAAASIDFSVEGGSLKLSLTVDTDIYSPVTWTYSNNANLAARNAPRLERFLSVLRDDLHARFLTTDGLVPVNAFGFAWP